MKILFGSIALSMALLATAARADGHAPFCLRCADADGRTMANWRVQDGSYRIKLKGDAEWSRVPDGAVGPMLILLQFGGAPCAIVKRAPK